MADGLQQTDVV